MIIHVLRLLLRWLRPPDQTLRQDRRRHCGLDGPMASSDDEAIGLKIAAAAARVSARAEGSPVPDWIANFRSPVRASSRLSPLPDSSDDSQDEQPLAAAVARAARPAEPKPDIPASEAQPEPGSPAPEPQQAAPAQARTAPGSKRKAPAAAPAPPARRAATGRGGAAAKQLLQGTVQPAGPAEGAEPAADAQPGPSDAKAKAKATSKRVLAAPGDTVKGAHASGAALCLVRAQLIGAQSQTRCR